jgi:hypothetical protein
MSRLLFRLTRANRRVAIEALSRAPDGYIMEIREERRSDEQNRALWGLLSQIARQRPTHNGVKMDADLWKAVFLDVLGSEMALMPKLNGDGFFPVGHRSSQLTKSEFAALLELMLAWCAEQGLTIEHFDDGQGAGGVSSPARAA